MPRPTWTPTTDEEHQALAALDAALTDRDKAQAAVWDAIRVARGLGIPAQLLADKADIGRATIYRHLEETPTPRAGPPGRSLQESGAQEAAEEGRRQVTGAAPRVAAGLDDVPR